MNASGAPRKHTILSDAIAWKAVQDIKKEKKTSLSNARNIFAMRLTKKLNQKVTARQIHLAEQRFKKNWTQEKINFLKISDIKKTLLDIEALLKCEEETDAYIAPWVEYYRLSTEKLEKKKIQSE